MSMIRSLFNVAVRALEKLETKRKMETKRELLMILEGIREEIDKPKIRDLPGNREWEQMESEKKLKIDRTLNQIREVTEKVENLVLLEELSARLKLEETLEMKREIDRTFKKVWDFLDRMDQWKRRSIEQSTHLLPEESSNRVTEGIHCMWPNHCGVPHEDYANPDASVPARDREHRVAPSELMEVDYKYSIPKCMEEYRSIGGFTSREDMEVYRLFKDKHNREIFLSLEDGQRVEWLRNMLASCS